MSDPASNVGIEDVLASVRRLVSAERRERPKSLTPSVSSAQDIAPAPEALVLTPDFRIAYVQGSDAPDAVADAAMLAEPGDEAPTGAADAERIAAPDTPAAKPEASQVIFEAADDASPTTLGEPPVVSLEERIAQLEAAVQAHANADFEPDGSEDLAQHRPDSVPDLTANFGPDMPAAEAAAEIGGDDTVAEAAADVEDGAPAEAVPADAVPADAVPAEAVIDGAHLADLARTIEREIGTIGDAPEDAPDQAEPERDAQEAEAPEAGAEASEDIPEGLPRRVDGSVDLGAMAEALIQSVAQEQDAAEADRVGPEDATPLSPEDPPEDPADDIDFDAWEEIYTARTDAAPDGDAASPNHLFHPKPSLVQGETSEDPSAADRAVEEDDWDDRLYPLDTDDEIGGFDLAEEAQEIDEDTLRDMVSEIVREELQGALGERITRNVRKLVRREIMRALSIRDFE